MATICCLVGASSEGVFHLVTAFATVAPEMEINVALFDVEMLEALSPQIIVIDTDSMKSEPLEALRQLRAVLPQCVLLAFATSADAASNFQRAGATAIILKSSTDAEVEAALGQLPLGESSGL